MTTPPLPHRPIKPAHAVAGGLVVGTLLAQLVPVVAPYDSSTGIALAAVEMAALLGAALYLYDEPRVRTLLLLMASSCCWTLLAYALLSVPTATAVSILNSVLGATVLVAILVPLPLASR